MRLAIVLVHYHTPELAAEAVAALAADVAAAAIEAEWRLVDNGSDEAGGARLDALGIGRIDPGRNLGYAGGVNLGIAGTTAEAILIANPDVLVLPGCVPALLAALERGAAVAGPRFYWDRGRRMLLPPAEPRTRRAEIVAALAGGSPAWAARARRRLRRDARRFGSATAEMPPLASHALSGSLLALRRAAWERVGPFDDGYPLYFEETDWLLRARRRGLAGAYVPAAEAIHLHAQSAAREPRAAAWFEESARRFRRRHYGPGLARLLLALGRRAARRPVGFPPAPFPAEGIDLAAHSAGRQGEALWVEVSPNPTGFPAAAERLPRPAGRWRLPAEIVHRLPGVPLAVRLVDGGGREVAAYTLRCGTAPAAS